MPDSATHSPFDAPAPERAFEIKKQSHRMGGFKACRFTDQDGRILPEYDFSQAIHNKYASRYAAGSAVVVLDPGAAAAFRVAAELVALDDAMSTLAEIDPRKAEVFSAR